MKVRKVIVLVSTDRILLRWLVGVDWNNTGLHKYYGVFNRMFVNSCWISLEKI